MATNNMHNLTTLIKRLEAATSRLEDIASSTQPFEGQAATDHHDGPSNGTSLAVPSHGQRNLHTPGASSTQLQESLPESIEDFDTLIHGDLKAYHDLSQTLSGAIEEQAAAVVGAFEAQRQFLLIATKAKKPDMSSQIYMETLKDLQEEMTRVDEIREKNRSSPQKNHLAMVADGISALAWVTIDPKPADYVIELFGGAQMYGNKVLNEQKEKYYHLKSRGFRFCRLCDKPGHDCSQVGRDTTQVEFIKSFYKLMRSLISYIKQHHVKGVQWNPQGIDAAEALRQQSTPNGAAAGFGSSAPPPPPMPAGGLPPLPGPPPAPTLGGPGKASAPDMGAVFDQLNQGEAITKGLKKVDPSQQTHKNPALRTQAPVPTRSDSQTSVGRGKSPTPPGKKPKPESMRTKKPPRKELDGNKWIIENFEDSQMPVEITAEINHSILITKCKNTTIRINGKGNAISIDNSPKTSIIIDSLVSSVDVIKCPSFALQVLDTVPTVLLDQVDGATIYLSMDSLQSEVFTSKCSNVNIYLPPESEDGDYKEESVPEQFRSYVRDGKLVTEIVEHKG